eukprot:SAG31_NODE_486_length_15001_cov_8.454405_8_plen_68_part_00
MLMNETLTDEIGGSPSVQQRSQIQSFNGTTDREVFRGVRTRTQTCAGSVTERSRPPYAATRATMSES